jgi:DNA repair protein RadC
MKELDEKHIHSGHRKRMQDKLARHDGDIFETYELLEMLLFFRLPYKNTNPIAKRLLHSFGSLKGVFEAERDALVEVSGVGEKCADFLRAVGGLLCLECDDEDVCCEGECENWHKVTLMLHALLADNKDAKLAIVAFDNPHRVISTELLYDVDINSGSMSAAYYTDFALKNDGKVDPILIAWYCVQYGKAVKKIDFPGLSQATQNFISRRKLWDAMEEIPDSEDPVKFCHKIIKELSKCCIQV